MPEPTEAPTVTLTIASCIEDAGYFVFGLDASQSMKEEGWNNANKFARDMARVLLALNEARLENDQAPHQVAAYYFNADAVDIQAFTDDFATFETAMIGLPYATVRDSKTNHPAGYMKADEWLHDKDSTTKTHILITDGAPHTAAGACRSDNGSPTESFEDGVPFADLKGDEGLPCLEACAVNNECDATKCAALGKPFDKNRDCGSQNNERKRGDDCVCAIHVAGRFNAKAHYSTTIVGVPNYNQEDERYTEIFKALGTSEQHYLDAQGCFKDPACLDRYVEQTLLATCRTPYHKCMRVPEPWIQRSGGGPHTQHNCNLGVDSSYCGPECKCQNLFFQKKSWYTGCLHAEASDDHAACVDDCNAPRGCCGNHGEDYEWQCHSNSCGGDGCCRASAGICHRACDYYYDQNLAVS